MKKDKLTPKQQQFVQEYLVDLNATQAAIRSGYSEKTAYAIGVENLRKPQIQAAIQEQMDKRSQKTNITAEKVLADIEEVKGRCMQHKPVMVYDKKLGEWVETGEFQFDSKGALKALELQGKHLKLFTDKHEVEHAGNIKVNFGIPRPPKKE